MPEHFQQCEAVIDRPMATMEIARLADQVTELGPLETARRPVNFRHGASPGLIGKDWREGFAERPVETGIVGNDQISRLDEGFQNGNVDHLPGNHGVGDAGQPCDFGRDGGCRLLKCTIDAGDVANLACVIEAKCYRANFDDFVRAVI
jgi:hypothetical protein